MYYTVSSSEVHTMIVAVYIGIIMLMRVVQSVLNKRTSRMIPRNSIAYLKYTAYYQSVAGALAGMLLLISVLRGATIESFGMTLLYASVSGIALGINCILGKYLLNLTTIALVSIFGTAGLLIPSIASIFLFGEKMMWYQWIALVVFMVGAYLIIGNSKKVYKKFTVKTLLLLLLNFTMNGLTMLIQKIFGMRVPEGNTSMFSFITFAVGGIISCVGLCVFALLSARAAKKQASTQTEHVAQAMAENTQAENTEQTTTENAQDECAQEATAEVAASENAPCENTPKENTQVSGNFRFIVPDKQEQKLPSLLYLFGVALAVAVFLINQLATLSTPLISSVILFTLINGGATVISALVGVIVYKEKLSVKGIIGLVLGIGSLILMQI